MRSSKVVCLLSDLGSGDPYAGAIKGVVLSICPDAKVVDITHEVPKFDVRYAAFLLSQVTPYYPQGTIFIAVVDPGVGTRRRILLVETSRSFLIGPDNGVLALAAERDGVRRVIWVQNERYMLPQRSTTFESRDVMAPVAAHLANGVEPDEFGSEVKDYARPSFLAYQVRGRVVEGEVLYVDSFGNIISNIPSGAIQKLGVKIGSELKAKIGDVNVKLKVCRTYAEAPIGSPLALIFAGTGFLEISINQGSAADFFGVKPGSPLKVKLIA